jgi:hypothetical protein
VALFNPWMQEIVLIKRMKGKLKLQIEIGNVNMNMNENASSSNLEVRLEEYWR